MVAKLNNTPLLVIVGPTASGKSNLALYLAQQLNGEIICADALTIRKHMDIGTAKPSHNEQSLVPHHLLDIVDPTQPFSVADYQKLAFKAINNITNKAKLPILVGGSGLYIDSVIYNYSFVPVNKTYNREDLNKLDKEALISLADKQGLSLSNLDTNNKRRLIRFIENNGISGSKQALKDSTLIVGIDCDQQLLKKRLQVRLDKMLADGLEDEVKNLSINFGWNNEAMKSIGYIEWREYFSGAINMNELKQQIIKDSLRLVKKQRTWFRRNKSINWLTTPVDMAKVVELVTTHYR